MHASPVRRQASPRGWLVLVVLCWCAGCRELPATTGPYSSAPGAEDSTVPPRDRKLLDALGQAEKAWRELSTASPTSISLAETEARYAEAVGRVVANLNGASKAVLPDGLPVWDWQRPGRMLRVGRYRLILGASISADDWTAGTYDEVLWVQKPARNPTVPLAIRSGVGATALAVRHGTAARRNREPGIPRRGYSLPATALLRFGPGGSATTTVRLEILDPRGASTISLGSGRTLPLAADFATPARQEVGVHNFGFLSLLGFFRPAKALDHSGMFFFEPFRRDRVPVVFIHGLNSDPSIWENVTAEIMADPELSRRCQFWYFFYPTGIPVTASAERLRRSLDNLRGFYDPAGDNPNMDRLILVGHSMGGLLAHLQVVDPGTHLYDAYFAVPPSKLDVSPAFQDTLRRDLLFSARRDVGQVVFICTPHRGSRLADWGIVRLLSRLVAVPEQILSATGRILTLDTDLLSPAMRRSGLRSITSSLDSLSPRNPYFGALEKLPIQRPFDTVLGDRGRGDSPHSSDGVVGYASAHWNGDRSETVVPYGHQCAPAPLVAKRLDQLLRQDVLRNPGSPRTPP